MKDWVAELSHWLHLQLLMLRWYNSCRYKVALATEIETTQSMQHSLRNLQRMRWFSSSRRTLPSSMFQLIFASSLFFNNFLINSDAWLPKDRSSIPLYSRAKTVQSSRNQTTTKFLTLRSICVKRMSRRNEVCTFPLTQSFVEFKSILEFNFHPQVKSVICSATSYFSQPTVTCALKRSPTISQSASSLTLSNGPDLGRLPKRHHFVA